MTKVILHGLLGKKFGEEHEFFVRKPSDALKALMANKSGFAKAFRTWGREGKFYQIICDGKLINSEQALDDKGEYQQIELVPAVLGASDEFKTVLGVVLIVVGYAFPGPWTPFLYAVGSSLLTMGIMGMLYPAPVPSFESSPQAKSFIFSSTENAQVQGVPVPVGYGRLRVGSKVISTCLRPERLSKAKQYSYEGGSMHGPEGNIGAGYMSNQSWNDLVQGWYLYNYQKINIRPIVQGRGV